MALPFFKKDNVYRVRKKIVCPTQELERLPWMLLNLFLWIRNVMAARATSAVSIRQTYEKILVVGGLKM